MRNKPADIVETHKYGKALQFNPEQGDLVAAVDGITIGLIKGEPFDTGLETWTDRERLKWISAQYAFFSRVAHVCSAYAKAVERRIDGGSV